MRMCVFLACVLAAAPAAAQAPVLAVSAAAGSTTVIERGVTLDSPPSGPVEWFARPDQGWVTVDPRTGVTPRRVAVRINPAGLPAGTHRATLRFTDDAGEAMLVVPVTLVLSERAAPTSAPARNTAPTSASTPAPEPSDTTPAPEPLAIALEALPVAIRNLPYSQAITVRGGRPPYALSVTQGRLPPGLIVKDGALTGMTHVPGVFPLTVAVRDSSAPPITATKHLALRVIVAFAGTAVSASVASMSAAAAAGERVSAGRIAVASGAQALEWRVGADQPWLRLSPDRGLAPGAFAVDVDATRLAPGAYTATITITMDGAPNSPLRIPVEVTVRR